jgi:prepilin-type N-terminal cleavage/methylation domain-containing protein
MRRKPVPWVWGSRRGFSLVEVCAAVVLFTIIVSGVLASQAASVNLTRTARDTSVATSDAQAALEEVLLQPMDAIPGAYAKGKAIARFNDLHLFEEEVLVLYPNMPGATVPDPLEIRVVVNWLDYGGRPRTLSLSTVKTR